ncbi:hypothetical protein GCM10023340_33050 [Nocardioides marinquilinus]|uniref:YcaO domain-containing protein n=1 Tax=Nocardioides marinquilinus TaxID=1210400 RepID=A0ABP9PW58_9ACTN
MTITQPSFESTALTHELATALDRLVAALGDVEVVVHRGFDLQTEREAVAAALGSGRPLVSMRIDAAEVLVGPRWRAGAPVGCAGCAEARQRQVLAHPLEAHPGLRRTGPATPLDPALPDLVDGAADVLAERPLADGELLAVGVEGQRRHRIARSNACSVCRVLPAASPDVEPPAPLALRAVPAHPDDASRGAEPTPLLDERTLDERVVDARFGPVRRILRESNAPFAMSMAVVAGGPVMGHGRALRFAGTRSVAVLEAYERLAGFPYDATVVTDRPMVDLGDHALDPRRLGTYTAEQRAHPTHDVEHFTPDLPIDWVWGHELATGRPRLVPADLAFYQYDYHHRHDLVAARAPGRTPRRCFLESSSGCALGTSFEEAALHALFEVAERDAFQVAWHRQRPLPAVPVDTIDDESVRALTRLVRSRGYDVHVLVATQDVDLPVLWVLAIREDGAFPASFSSAGSGIDPVAAVVSGLREVAQLVTMPIDWSPETVAPMLEDRWQVLQLEDHVRYYSVAQTAPRAAVGLGGPTTTMAEAFPDWPAAISRAAGGDVRGLLHLVADRFAAAGCPDVVLVDQSSVEHHDQGIAAVRALVPGTVPMCFGTAHQRLEGIPRLDAALAEAPSGPLDPHPFP